MSEEERKEKQSFLKRYSIVIILFVFVTYLLPLSIHLFVRLTGLSNYENPPVFLPFLLWSANLLMLIGIIFIISFGTVWLLKLIGGISFNPILKITLILSQLIFFIVAMKICLSGLIGIVKMLFSLK